MKSSIYLLLASIILFTGCSGIKTYPNKMEKNLHVTTKTESGSMFTNIKAAVDIYKVHTDCSTEYEGTIQLDRPSVDIGIPSGRLSYLVFVFASGGFLSSHNGIISQNTLLKPRSGYHYDVEASYIEDIYHVEIHEKGKKKSREIDLVELNTCQPLAKKVKK